MRNGLSVSCWLLLVCLSTPIALSPARADQNGSPPNVILILADDLGFGDLSCYGQVKFQTPNIDRLAKEGMRFTDHYSGNTVCSPSRACLMTGQHSGHCYLRSNMSGERGAALDPEMIVLPELFKQAGYATGAFGKWGLGHTYLDGPENPLKHGFDRFYGWKSQTVAHTYYPSTIVDDGTELPVAPGTFVHDLVMEKARDFISTNARERQPFFCYLPTAVPHAAMHAPPELHQKWREKLAEFDNKVGKYGAGPGEECPDVVNPIAGFAAMMENFDNEVGAILELLEQVGIADNTLVMFSSDNGAHREGGHDPDFWNSTGNLRGHKRDMHEGGIRVPLLVRWPNGIQPGSISRLPCAFWDYLPTFAELLDQPLPPQADGISILPTLRGLNEQQIAREHLYWEFRKGNEQALFSQAVRFGDWKAYLEVGKPLELYNLADDPWEEQNRSSDYPELVEKIHQMISASSNDSFLKTN